MNSIAHISDFLMVETGCLSLHFLCVEQLDADKPGAEMGVQLGAGP